ncbi:hypothetical protein CFH99_24390 [Nocardioides aromaticivorans]|uniref:TniQ domain-containing protein n=1 Tax=Nocardioides aromaticivorans TaxID=200618 RepID=A0ABX7PT08_9ACTN|nr:TniQ family protein [Nocardioides aromaticivorans]QSR28765.1 hypothetical protein CFH99_24390 [Nocardioides aromaticivorans]
MRLRSRPQLHPDESITSHYVRTLQACGLRPHDLHRRSSAKVDWDRVTPYRVQDQFFRSWSRLSHQPIDQLRAATMLRYKDAIPAFIDVATGKRELHQIARATWTWPSSTQACVACLDARPSVWKLEWRLPWIFDCPDHQRLLATHCRLCAQQFTEHHHCPLTLVQVPQWPNSPAILPATGQMIETAAFIRSVLAGEPADLGHVVAKGTEYLEGLRGLSGLIEHIERRRDSKSGSDSATIRRAAAAAPRDARRRAHLLSTAHELLAQPPDATADRLRTAIRESVDGTTSTGTWLRDHSHVTTLTEPIFAILANEQRSVGRVQLLGPSNPTLNVPQMIASDTWAKLKECTSASESTGRCYASMLLVKLTRSSTWAEAGAALNLPQDIASQVARTGTAKLIDDKRFTEIVARLVHEPATIDWRARERRMYALLDDQKWIAATAQEAGVPHLVAGLVRERLWALWAQGHPRVQLQRWPMSRSERQQVANQKRRLTAAQVQTMLDCVAKSG